MAKLPKSRSLSRPLLVSAGSCIPEWVLSHFGWVDQPLVKHVRFAEFLVFWGHAMFDCITMSYGGFDGVINFVIDVALTENLDQPCVLHYVEYGALHV